MVKSRLCVPLRKNCFVSSLLYEPKCNNPLKFGGVLISTFVQPKCLRNFNHLSNYFGILCILRVAYAFHQDLKKNVPCYVKLVKQIKIWQHHEKFSKNLVHISFFTTDNYNLTLSKQFQIIDAAYFKLIVH